MTAMWIVTLEASAASLSAGSMPVGTKMLSSLESALVNVRTKFPGEDLRFMSGKTELTELEFRKIPPDGSSELKVLGANDVERIRLEIT